MYKHGHYSKKLPQRNWVVVSTTHRFDGDFEDRYYFETEAKALDQIETWKRIDKELESEIEINKEIYFGTDYRVEKIN